MSEPNTTYALRPGLPALPERMKRLPVDSRGFPVPWFVAKLPDGSWDFRLIRDNGLVDAVKNDTCWLCGLKLGVYKAFVIGPMCAVSRATSEPPCHRECADFALHACPFMLNPDMRRPRNRPFPEGTQPPSGDHIERNPGAFCLWITKSYTIIDLSRHRRGADGVLFEVGDPTHVSWWARGREATYDEVMAAIESGLDLLHASATKDYGTKQATQIIKDNLKRVKPYLPPEPVDQITENAKTMGKMLGGIVEAFHG